MKPNRAIVEEVIQFAFRTGPWGMAKFLLAIQLAWAVRRGFAELTPEGRKWLDAEREKMKADAFDTIRPRTSS